MMTLEEEKDLLREAAMIDYQLKQWSRDLVAAGSLLLELAYSAEHKQKPRIIVDHKWDDLLDDIDFEPATPEIGYVAARLKRLVDGVEEIRYLLPRFNDVFLACLTNKEVI